MNFYEPTETMCPREDFDGMIGGYFSIRYVSHPNLYISSRYMDVHSLPRTISKGASKRITVLNEVNI